LTEAEFDLIDSLYFTLSFEQLQKDLDWEENVIRTELKKAMERGWVKALVKGTEEEIYDFSIIERNYTEYLYLATKKGLMVHNSR
jgi:hypothetical protein